MFASIRRIGNALLIVGVLSFSMSLLSTVSIQCGTGSTGCLATVLTASFMETPMSYDTRNQVMAETTQAYTEKEGFTLPRTNSVVQLVGGYLLLVGVLVLITLECFQFYYIRKFLKSRRVAK